MIFSINYLQICYLSLENWLLFKQRKTEKQKNRKTIEPFSGAIQFSRYKSIHSLILYLIWPDISKEYNKIASKMLTIRVS